MPRLPKFRLRPRHRAHAVLVTLLMPCLAACGADSPAEPAGSSTGSLQVTVQAVGPNTITGAYQVALDGGPAQALPPSGTLPDVAVGSHHVALGALPPFCTATPTTQDITVAANAKASTQFTVSCVRHLIFGRLIGSQWALYRVGADGTGLGLVNGVAVNGAVAAWAPDRSRIAFSRLSGSTAAGVFTLRLDSAGATVAPLPDAGPSMRDASPAWAPDGRTLAVTTYDYSDSWNVRAAIMRVGPDGAGRVRLTDSAVFAQGAAWQPDGRRIAYSAAPISVVDGRTMLGRTNLWLANADGTNPTRLTEDEVNGAPAWSPDGRYLVYQGATDLFVLDLEHREQPARQLTTDGSWSGQPAWSPDGLWIAFSAVRDGVNGIYLVHPDGTGEVRLTTNPSIDRSPTWEP